METGKTVSRSAKPKKERTTKQKIKHKYNQFVREKKPGNFKVLPAFAATLFGGIFGGVGYTFYNSIKTSPTKKVLKDIKIKNIEELDNELPNILSEWQTTYYNYIPAESEESYKKTVLDAIRCIDEIFGIHLITLNSRYVPDIRDSVDAKLFLDFANINFQKSLKYFRGNELVRATEHYQKIMDIVQSHVDNIEHIGGFIEA
jgi:hypothetical protein